MAADIPIGLNPSSLGGKKAAKTSVAYGHSIFKIQINSNPLLCLLLLSLVSWVRGAVVTKGLVATFQTRTPPGQITGLAWYNNYLLATHNKSVDSTLRLWNIATGLNDFSLITPPNPSNLVVYKDERSIDQAMFVSGNTIYRLAPGNTLKAFKTLNEPITSLHVGPASLSVYGGTSSGLIYKWSMATGAQVWKINLQPSSGISFGKNWAVTTFYERNGRLYIGTADGWVKGFDRNTGKPLKQETIIYSDGGMHELKPIEALTGNIKNQLIAAYGNNAWISDIAINLFRFKITHPGRVMALLVKGKSLFTGSSDGMTYKWSMIESPYTDPTYAISNTYAKHDGAVRVILFKDNFLFTGSDDGTIKKWNI